MRADNGRHVFTYSLLAWDGSFLDSPVTAEAYDLNVPPLCAPGTCGTMNAFSVSAANVFIDTVKPAEDGSGDLVLRLYEAKNADTDCVLRVNLPAARAWKTNLLENREEELPLEDGKIRLHFHNFEVTTVRLAR